MIVICYFTSHPKHGLRQQTFDLHFPVAGGQELGSGLPWVVQAGGSHLEAPT